MNNQNNDNTFEVGNPFKVGDKVRFNDPTRTFDPLPDEDYIALPTGECVVERAHGVIVDVRDATGSLRRGWHRNWFVASDTVTTVEVPADSLKTVLEWIFLLATQGKAHLTMDNREVLHAARELHDSLLNPESELREKVRSLMSQPMDDRIDAIIAAVREAEQS